MEEFDLIPVIKELIEGYKHQGEEIAELRSIIMENLINPINEAYEAEQHDNALSDFRCKYAEKLEPFGSKLKSIEGDDFDIIEKAFDDFSKRTDGMDSDTYVDKLAEKVSSQLDVIGKAFGVEPEEIKEVSVETKDGDEKTVEVDNTEETKEEVVDETPAEEVVESDTTESDKEDDSESDESTDTPDDDDENYKYWEEFLKK